MSYIKEWPDATLWSLKHIVASRVRANPSDKIEQEELSKIEEEILLREHRLNKSALKRGVS